MGPVLFVPGIGPIASSEREVGAVIRKGPFRLIAWIQAEKFVELSSSRRAKEDIGGLLVRMQKIEPCSPFHIAAADCKGGGVASIKIIGINPGSQRHLSHIVHTTDLFGLFLGLGKRRKEHAGQNRDDGDDDQEFDQGESSQQGLMPQWALGDGFHGVVFWQRWVKDHLRE